jgi:hypothetical protein
MLARFNVDPVTEVMTADKILQVAEGGKVGRLDFTGKDPCISRDSFTVTTATSTRLEIKYTGLGPCYVIRGISGRSSPVQKDGETSEKSLTNGDAIVLVGKGAKVKLTPILEDEQDQGTLLIDWGEETQAQDTQVPVAIVEVSSREPTPTEGPTRRRVVQENDESSTPSDDELPGRKRKQSDRLVSDDDEVQPKPELGEAPKPAKKPRKPKADGAPRKPKVVADGAAPKASGKPHVRKPKVVVDGAAPKASGKPRVRKPKVVVDGAAPKASGKPRVRKPKAQPGALESILHKNLLMSEDEVKLRAKNEQRFLQRRKQTSDNVQVDEPRSQDDDDKMTDADREFITTHPDDHHLVDDDAIGALVGMQSKNYVALGCMKASIAKNSKLFERAGVDVAALQQGRNEHLGHHLYGKLLKLSTKASTGPAAQQAIALSTQNNMLDQRFPFTSDFLASGPRGPVDVVRVHQSHRAQEDARKAALAKLEADRIARKLPVGNPEPVEVSEDAVKKWHKLKKEDTDLYAKFDY